MNGKILLTGLKQLLTFDGPAAPRAGRLMSETGLIKDAAVLVENGHVVMAGKRAEVESDGRCADAEELRVSGVAVPGFCDSHTHPVFAASRINDFSLRLAGTSYQQIKAMGGGIVSSINGVRQASEYELEKLAVSRFNRFLRCGTTSIEAKSGYGLSLESEIKSLSALSRAGKKTPATIVPTLLAAHGVPPEFTSADDYAEYVIADILPEAAARRLAVFCDVFCEEGYFSPEKTVRILSAAKSCGLKGKVHAEQLSHFGGARAAAEAGAVSADHADCCDEDDIAALRGAGVIATLLPASNYFLGLSKYPPARAMIDARLPVALATDFNPGTCPCWNMQFVISAACTQMKMTAAEALCAATVNGAWAMGLGGQRGVIAPGLPADIAVFAADDYNEIAYYFGDNQCVLTMKDGNVLPAANG